MDPARPLRLHSEKGKFYILVKGSKANKIVKKYVKIPSQYSNSLAQAQKYVLNKLPKIKIKSIKRRSNKGRKRQAARKVYEKRIDATKKQLLARLDELTKKYNELLKANSNKMQLEMVDNLRKQTANILRRLDAQPQQLMLEPPPVAKMIEGPKPDRKEPDEEKPDNVDDPYSSSKVVEELSDAKIKLANQQAKRAEEAERRRLGQLRRRDREREQPAAAPRWPAPIRPPPLPEIDMDDPDPPDADLDYISPPLPSDFEPVSDDDRSNASEEQRMLNEFIDQQSALESLDQGNIPGRGRRGRALWTDEIDDYFRDTPEYLGTFASDELDDIDKIDLPAAMVINTANSNQPGEHWVALYISPTSVEYYDPFGDIPSDKLLASIKTLVKRQDLPNLLKLKINHQKNQDNRSSSCGYFAIRFLDERLHDTSFKDATRFKQQGGEETIKKEFKLI